MKRQIKFRIWKAETKQWVNFPERGLYSFEPIIHPDYTNCDYFVIQQFTGLQDKNGKDIYEGDIVSWKHPMEDFGEVLFVTMDLGPDIAFFGVKTKRLGLCHFQSDDGYEVVGNIFETPELLS